MPLLVFEKFGQTKAIPANETKSISFRRYYLQTSFTEPSGAADFNPKEYFDTDNDPMDPADRVLTEGVTPSATELRNSDYTATLVQYGDRVVITDVVMDTHEDPVMSEAIAILGEQAAVIIEKSRFNVLKAGSNVFYANGSARTDVNTVFSLADQRKVTPVPQT
jgi:N4-gp56 family major capsid protein